MTTMTPMTTGGEFDLQISDARRFPGKAQPQAAEHLVSPVSAPPAQAPRIYLVPLLASGGYTKDGILQGVIGPTSVGDHLHCKLAIREGFMQGGQNSKRLLAFGIIY